MHGRWVRYGAGALLTALLAVFGLVFAASAADRSAPASAKGQVKDKIERVRAFRVTQQEREAAADRVKAMRAQVDLLTFRPAGVRTQAASPPGPGGVPDYFGTTANWAYSPPLRKFVDTLPGLGPDNANNLGNYIPVAKPDTKTYPGSDYYEIELRQFTQQMHSDLPPTTFRGYVQVNKGTDGNGDNTLDPDPIHYLGPTIVAKRDRPVRIKFTNKLPTGEAGDLFIPVDTSVMGAGEGPDGSMYTENRATLHLHGGLSPWISDGTPHQWITPAGENTPYPKGVSVKNVPDMPDPGDGSQTFFYTNAQSARLMFYHDHSYGITRLNVYAGEAAGYLIEDAAEKKLVQDGTIPSEQIPLILQDKTFVDSATVRVTDPTWNWGTGALDTTTGIREVNHGDLWLPHVYVPAQNPADPGGMNATGRWHYGPWFWPPIPSNMFKHPPIPNPYYDPINAPWEPPLMPATPNPSMGMEAFHDTPIVNGTAYPVMTVQPKAYRFRVLNASNDRFFNLQMYEANNTKQVTRLGGATRYDVSISAAKKAYPGWLGVKHVVIASGEDRAQADVLTAAGLAGALDAPLLITPYGSLYPNLATELRRMPRGVRVHIVGGTGSVSTLTESQIRGVSRVKSVDRIAGADRYVVAVNVATRMKAELGAAFPDAVFIANGSRTDAMYDALAASAVSFKAHMPVLLVTDKFAPPSTVAALTTLGLTKRYIVGGPGSVSASTASALGVAAADRIWGVDRFSTATAFAERAVAEGWIEYYRTGFAAATFDAATGGACMGKMGGVLLYMQPTSLPWPTQTHLGSFKDLIQAGFVFGGTVSVQPQMLDRIRVLIELPIKSEVSMVPAVPTEGYPDTWPTDGRLGGAPDPDTSGPEWIQIGTEGGFLPKPAVIPQQPITWNMDPTTFTMGNVQDHSLLVAPAERADVIVDFSEYAGKTLILYNDAPTAFPALDQRTDFFTGGPDMRDTGGNAPTRIGFGSNTRTVMQIKVASATPEPIFDLDALNAAFASTPTTPGVFASSQNPIIIPEARYNEAYGTTTFSPDPYVRIYQNEATVTTLDSREVTIGLEPKAIQDETSEVWDYEYGRMSGKLGLEMPRTNAGNANFILYSFFDPTTEILQDSMTPLSPVGEDGTQIWKITHNGVDTHPIHFHLFDVQVINRVGWDNAVYPPDDNELGWKDTVRISPLQDTIVALKPVSPKVPFGVPESVRLLNPTAPLGDTMGFSNLDPLTGQLMNDPVRNLPTSFGWEYVWHCHILSHEEMDMMRPMKLIVAHDLPEPSALAVAGLPGADPVLRWTDATPPSDPRSWGHPRGEIGYRIERATVDAGGVESSYTVIGMPLANATSFTDTGTVGGTAYRYRIYAYNAAGETVSNAVTVGPEGFFASYTITPSVFGSGTITPSAPEVVASGSDSSTFTIAPEPGSEIAAVFVDGVSVGAVTEYRFTDVRNDHTIWASFVKP